MQVEAFSNLSDAILDILSVLSLRDAHLLTGVASLFEMRRVLEDAKQSSDEAFGNEGGGWPVEGGGEPIDGRREPVEGSGKPVEKRGAD